jgi:hypothetical protein
MRINITGAEIEQNGNVFQVVYKGQVVLVDKLHAVCLCCALDEERLERLAGQNVIAARFG